MQYKREWQVLDIKLPKPNGRFQCLPLNCKDVMLLGSSYKKEVYVLDVVNDGVPF